jgi:hypothetical protein
MSIFTAQKLAVGLVIRYVSLNIIEKLLSIDETRSPRLELDTVFLFVTKFPVFFELLKPSLSDPGQFFASVVFVSVTPRWNKRL